jgi:CTD kinase subunit alpha
VTCFESELPVLMTQIMMLISLTRWLSPAGLDLAEELLAFDPLHRATAVQALEAAYFKAEDPPPMMPTGLSSLEGEWHELETKRERAKKRRKIEGGTAQ